MNRSNPTGSSSYAFNTSFLQSLRALLEEMLLSLQNKRMADWLAAASKCFGMPNPEPCALSVSWMVKCGG
jgi:hypothetical protein